ncbi:putative RNA methyltransferase [Antrihabitans cavernicola]|uniref:Methyltransferase domain-containing protein n=1 Tax=Antrihabitans cavernicola TaxID=2495913 RepID=A0A5A7SED2_9NOCA|nr:methyltransferase domain-containing protein [Spelaeibacter cavernicola]KAA0022581.1 methyltransferase domain-containing protein [Spelaeibacter cavernicola]
MLADIVDLLACPVCGSSVEIDDRIVLCQLGHSFDIARQGYVSLSTGAASKISGDTAEMIASRADFLDDGHFDAIGDAVARAIEDTRGPAPVRILEIGAGTGHYVARALDEVPDAQAIGIDVSKAAARRIARAHDRLGSVVADAWKRLPILDGSITHTLSIFSPRNADEIRRVTSSDGAFIVVTPTPRHLIELIEPLGMVSVDEDKTRRLGDSMAGRFDRIARTPVEYPMTLDADAIRAVVAMGPSARHIDDRQLTERVAAIEAPATVTASVVVSTYRPRLAITSS